MGKVNENTMNQGKFLGRRGINSEFSILFHESIKTRLVIDANADFTDN